MTKDHEIPINVIVLENVEQEREDLIVGYYEIIKTCKKKVELIAAIQMICDEIHELTLREVLVKQIQFQAKVLEETKKR